MAAARGVVAHMLAGPELALDGPSRIRDGDVDPLHSVIDQIIAGNGSLAGVTENPFLVKVPMPAFPVVDISNDGSPLDDGLARPVPGGAGVWNGTEHVFFRRIVHAYLCAACGVLGNDGRAAAVPVFPRLVRSPATGKLVSLVCRRFTGFKYIDAYMPVRTSTSMFACICDGVTRGFNISPSDVFTNPAQLIEYVSYSIRIAIRSRATRWNATVQNTPFVIFVASHPGATRAAVEEVLDPDVEDTEGIRPHLDRCRLFVCGEDGKFPGWDDRGTRERTRSLLVCTSGA